MCVLLKSSDTLLPKTDIAVLISQVEKLRHREAVMKTELKYEGKSRHEKAFSFSEILN